MRTELLFGALALAAYLLAFYYMFILVMGIYRAHLTKRLQGIPLWLCLPAVALGYLLDVVSNQTVAALLFLDPPREWLVTSRLQRYKATETGWRLRVAEAICEGLLDVFDPSGEHC